MHTDRKQMTLSHNASWHVYSAMHMLSYIKFGSVNSVYDPCCMYVSVILSLCFPVVTCTKMWEMSIESTEQMFVCAWKRLNSERICLSQRDITECRLQSFSHIMTAFSTLFTLKHTHITQYTQVCSKDILEAQRTHNQPCISILWAFAPNI